MCQRYTAKQDLAVGSTLYIWRHEGAIYMKQPELEIAKMSDLFSVWGDNERTNQAKTVFLYVVNWANLYLLHKATRGGHAFPSTNTDW